MANQENEQQFVKGFNHGYSLSKHDTDLLSQVLATENNWSNYIDGMRSGQKEYLKEHALEKLQTKSTLNQPDYQKAFNRGYRIAQFDSNLADQLTTIKSDTPTMAGFKDGMEQLNSEKPKDRYPDWLKKDRFEKDDTNPDKSIDRDMEPDR